MEWDVVVEGKRIGSVVESTEELARLAALHKFAVVEGEQLPSEFGIESHQDFEVYPR